MRIALSVIGALLAQCAVVVAIALIPASWLVFGIAFALVWTLGKGGPSGLPSGFIHGR